MIFLLTLPDELLIHICEFLVHPPAILTSTFEKPPPLDDLIALATTCWHFRGIAWPLRFRFVRLTRKTLESGCFSYRYTLEHARAMYIEVAMGDDVLADKIIRLLVRAKHVTSVHLTLSSTFYSRMEPSLPSSEQYKLAEPHLRLFEALSNSLPRLAHVSLAAGVWPIRSEMVICWPPTLLSLELCSTSRKALDNPTDLKLEPSKFPSIRSLTLNIRVVFWADLPLGDPEEGGFQWLESLCLDNFASKLVADTEFDKWLNETFIPHLRIFPNLRNLTFHPPHILRPGVNVNEMVAVQRKWVESLVKSPSSPNLASIEFGAYYDENSPKFMEPIGVWKVQRQQQAERRGIAIILMSSASQE